MLLLKLGSKLPNLVKKFEFVPKIRQNEDLISAKWTAHPLCECTETSTVEYISLQTVFSLV